VTATAMDLHFYQISRRVFANSKACLLPFLLRKYLCWDTSSQLVELKMNELTPLHVRSQPRPAPHNFLK
jgi:hypothetical protein